VLYQRTKYLLLYLNTLHRLEETKQSEPADMKMDMNFNSSAVKKKMAL